MIYVSIDCGIDGAAAVFDGAYLLGVYSLPYHKIGKQQILEIDKLLRLIHKDTNTHDVERVFIEEVNFIRGQGGVSSFSFGQRFGEAKSLASSFTDDIVFISPMKWKKAVGLIGYDKKQSAVLAAKIYEHKKAEFIQANKRCKDGFKYFDGRGDAVMIGLAALKLGLTEL